MERKIGTISRGVRCPIIREGDNLANIVVTSVLEAAESENIELRDRDVIAITESIVARSQGNYIIREGDNLANIVVTSVLEAAESENIELRDRDVIAITESIVARSQGNYASVSAIAQDVKEKLGGETIGVIFPILSRNRFAICLRGIAAGAKKVVLMLSYPSDEVGNELVSLDKLDEAGINPYSDVLTLERYRELFGENKHPFTGVDYVDYYGNLIKESGAEVEIIFANNPKAILDYTKNVLTCDIHTRARTKRILKANGAERVCGLDDILTTSIDGNGHNEKFGLLGSNKSTEDTVKLFPKECKDLVLDIQKQILDTLRNVRI